jgi:hypothetical protein
MLDKLNEAMAVLPELLKKRELWDSLIVNRRKPFTYRVFTTLPNGLRCCLHKFDPCNVEESFYHPHPWPGAFVIMDGSYRMKVGLAFDRTSKPLDVIDEIFHKFSSYSITNPLTFHSVIPLETVYSVMVNDTPWPAEVCHVEVKTTKGKDLDKMPEEDLLNHLNKFQDFVWEYNHWLKLTAKDADREKLAEQFAKELIEKKR